MSDGRKLKVFLKNLEGSFHGTDDFFKFALYLRSISVTNSALAA
jgi:hypothetical protein